MDEIPPTPDALEEALALSGAILKDLELSQLPLSTIVLKVGRLARLLNLFDYQTVMEYEASGYPREPGGMTPEQWASAVRAKRIYPQMDTKSGKVQRYAYTESIGDFEEMVTSGHLGLQAAADPDVAVSSANPNQYLPVPHGNMYERNQLRAKISEAAKRLSERRAFVYHFVLGLHYELKFSGVASDVFSRIRTRVDSVVGSTLVGAVQRFAAIHDALRSENPEDWSNAVHGCRRLLEALADAVFPAQTEDRVVEEGGRKRTIKVGQSNYINRIMCFVEDHATSEKFAQIVGSHLRYLGDRLDAMAEAGSKGSHTTITSREAADRTVIYTYLLVGDILSLAETGNKNDMGQ